MHLPRIDSHQHFWRPARGDYGWLDPSVPALAPLYRDILPDDMRPLLEAHGIGQTVLVQAAATEAETDFLLSLADAHPFIAGVVGWVDVGSAASVATLERWARHGKLKAVRPMLQDLPDNDWIAHAPHPDVVQALIDLGLRFDALVMPWQLGGLLRFVRRWPALPVVIDHAAKPQLADVAAGGWSAPWAAQWEAGMAALAAQPQVLCKLSGLLTEAGGAARDDLQAGFDALQPVWRRLLAWFGPQRLLWGSDWPVLTLAAPYDHWVALTERLLAPLPDADRAAIWAGNAARFYGLNPGSNP